MWQVELLGTPDYSSPLNTGVMLLKPSAARYAEGVQVLQRCVFNRTLGWELAGRPSTLSVTPRRVRRRGDDGASGAGGTSGKRWAAAARGALQITRAYRQDDWVGLPR